MVEWHDCTRAEVKDFWNSIEQILIKGEYEEINKMELSMRNSYYHLLTFVGEMYDSGAINEKQLNYWNQEEAYNFFTQDKWSQWEKNNSWKRPKAKDPTKAYYRDDLLDLTLSDAELVYQLRRSRGFVFVEKSGFLQDLKLISSYGWVVLAGEGFSSRELRETIMRNFPERLIVVVHDYDKAGEMIHDVFSEGSRRTEHIGLVFSNVLDLGLRLEDVEELKLPKAPESRKVRKKNIDAWRVELNALTILNRSKGIKNPLLWYVAKRMYDEGLDLFEESQKYHEALKAHIKHQFWVAIFSRVNKRIEEAIKFFKIEDDDITEIVSSKDHSNYGYFNGKEFKDLDQYIYTIIWREIKPALKEGEEYAKELLKKAGVKLDEFG